MICTLRSQQNLSKTSEIRVAQQYIMLQGQQKGRKRTTNPWMRTGYLPWVKGIREKFSTGSRVKMKFRG